MAGFDSNTIFTSRLCVVCIGKNHCTLLDYEVCVKQDMIVSYMNLTVERLALPCFHIHAGEKLNVTFMPVGLTVLSYLPADYAWFVLEIALYIA